MEGVVDLRLKKKESTRRPGATVRVRSSGDRSENCGRPPGIAVPGGVPPIVQSALSERGRKLCS